MLFSSILIITRASYCILCLVTNIHYLIFRISNCLLDFIDYFTHSYYYKQ